MQKIGRSAETEENKKKIKEVFLAFPIQKIMIAMQAVCTTVRNTLPHSVVKDEFDAVSA